LVSDIVDLLWLSSLLTWQIETLSGKTIKHLEFDNYEKKIVEKLRVVIVGWTCPDFVSPSGFKTIAQVEQLYDAVNSGSCKAEKLSPTAWAERKASNRSRHALGEDVYGKEEVTRGVKHKTTGNDEP
jgi:hypothetical protein